MHPVDDVLLPDQIQRPDQLHPLKVCTVQLRHHRLDLRPVQHAHQDRLHDIIKVMAEGDLVTAELLRPAVQVPPSHSSAQIAGGFHIVLRHDLEYIRLKNRDRYMEQLRIPPDRLVIDRIITRIHHEKDEFKIFLPVPLQLLK